MIEQTLVMLKPDAVKRGLVGEILARFEKKGLKIVRMKMIELGKRRAEALYAEHAGKPFFDDLVAFTISGPVVAVRLSGYETVKVVRQIVGPTAGANALPGTIRGDFASGSPTRENLVHASDSQASADRESTVFFG